MKKILIVDDYPDILEGLSYVLKDHYEVTTAGNLTEAKKEVSTTVFDVICSDYAMPDGTGLELLEFCRQEKFSMLFILMSAMREERIVMEAKLHGAVFMEKNRQRFDFVSSRKCELNNSNMIVSCGLGSSVIPIRFNNRPEVIVIELLNTDL